MDAQVLRKLKEDAEAVLGKTISQAFITVPANFQRIPASGDQGSGRTGGFAGSLNY